MNIDFDQQLLQISRQHKLDQQTLNELKLENNTLKQEISSLQNQLNQFLNKHIPVIHTNDCTCKCEFNEKLKKQIILNNNNNNNNNNDTSDNNANPVIKVSISNTSNKPLSSTPEQLAQPVPSSQFAINIIPNTHSDANINNNNNNNNAMVDENNNLNNLNISAIPVEQSQGGSVQTQPLVFDIIFNENNANKQRGQSVNVQNADDVFQEIDKQADDNNAGKHKLSARKRKIVESESECDKQARINSIEALKTAISASETHRQAGSTFYNMHKFDESIPHYQSALDVLNDAIKTTSLDVYKYKELKQQSNNSNNNYAPELLRAQLEFIDEYTSIIASLVTSYCKVGRYNDSHALTEKMIEIKPDWYKGYSLAATVYFYEKKYEQAENYYKLALKCELNKSERDKIVHRLEMAQTGVKQLQHSAQKAKQSNNNNNNNPNMVPLSPFRQAISPFPIHIHQDENLTNSNLQVPGSSSRATSPIPKQSDNTGATIRSPLKRLNVNTLTNRTNNASPVPASKAAKDTIIDTHLPIITYAGIKDLMGPEQFSQAIKLFEEKQVYQFKTELKQNHPIIQGRCFKESEKKRSKQHTNVELFNQLIEFDDNKVVHYECDCEKPEIQNDDNKNNNKDLDNNNNGSLDNKLQIKYTPKVLSDGTIIPAYAPCVHIGAVLLLIRKRQIESGSITTDTETQQPISKRKYLYVTPSHILSESDKQKEIELGKHFESLTSAKLQSLLTLNNQKKSGLKNELVARCVDCCMYGSLPKCELCKTGNLYYTSGIYRCHGAFDEIFKKRAPCQFIAEKVQRKAWIEK